MYHTGGLAFLELESRDRRRHALTICSPQSMHMTRTSRVARTLMPQHGHTYLRVDDSAFPPGGRGLALYQHFYHVRIALIVDSHAMLSSRRTRAPTPLALLCSQTAPYKNLNTRF